MKKSGKLLFVAACIGAIASLGLQSYSHAQACDVAAQSLMVQGDVDLKTRAKAAYVVDDTMQNVMYAHNEMQRLPIASMCKIMTLTLCFDAIKEGALAMDELISVSERAASMGGSQVFLEANGKYLVRELIKSIVVCSANDSCVAMAERICGSEDLFVDKMNEKAKEIGANNTLFANCTGLPKEPQYSCAKDVAIMLKNLLENEEYYEFGKVWLEKFNHPTGRYTEITNTNKLVRFYDGCDGGKTGFTNEAGFCLAATAKRNKLRVISVVIGEESSANRFEDVRKTFDYAFANYTAERIVEKDCELDEKMTVSGGKEKLLSVCPARSVYLVAKRGEKQVITIESNCPAVKAPIEKGAHVGELVIFKNGVEMDRVPLLAMNTIKKAKFFDRFKDIAQEWNG